MSADKHRSRDRRRALIYKASHDWRGFPVGPGQRGDLYAFRRNLKNRDVKRLIREGHLAVRKIGRGTIKKTHLVVVP